MLGDMVGTPHVDFAAGVILGELYQWGRWMTLNPGKPKRGYWDVGIPHLVMNLVAIVGVDVLWSGGMLDKVINAVLPSASWANVGIPFTPQVGFMLGAGADIMGDQVAYLARIFIGKVFPSFAPTPPSAPQPSAPEVKP